MGEAAARKVNEIEEVRHRLEMDLQELEDRMPAPVRSAKSLLGLALGASIMAFLALRRMRGRRPGARPAAEVILKVVREDR
ncbi:MAG TPA: hypothetical protein VLA90_02565 [Actinomycetota bacterium]|nr:hypothetical protein [Actinomycetota bacterium]